MRSALVVFVLVTLPVTAEDQLLQQAASVFTRAVESPSTAIPAAVLMRAMAIAVIPGAAKDGNGYHGEGVVSVRGARSDLWSPPAVIAFDGAVPLDLDSAAVDFILIAQTRRGLDYFLAQGSPGAPSIRIVPGAIGHSTPMRIDADIVAYMQFDRYFAGVSIDDWAVRDLPASNTALYGRPYSTDDIVRGAGFFQLPRGARLWRETIVRYFREMS